MNDGTDGGRGSRRRAGPRRAGALAAALAGIALLASACGGGRPGSGSPAAAGTTAYQQALSYTSCMRWHGVPGFPDPTSQGTFIPTGIDPHSPQFQSAMRTCHHLLPAGSGQRTAAQQQQVESNALKFAVCVRAHGIPGFPDPVFLGTTVDFKVPKGLSQSSPRFLSAMRTCRTLQKAQPKGGTS
jgi:hypothetical protein